MTVAGICFLVTLVLDLLDGLVFKDIEFTFFAGLFGVVLSCGGLWLVYVLITDHRTLLLISSDGLQFGEQSYSWEDIAEIGVLPRTRSRKDLYLRPRSQPIAFELTPTKGLKSEEIAVLFAALNSEVLRRYPHIRLTGGDGEVAQSDSSGR